MLLSHKSGKDEEAIQTWRRSKCEVDVIMWKAAVVKCKYVQLDSPSTLQSSLLNPGNSIAHPLCGGEHPYPQAPCRSFHVAPSHTSIRCPALFMISDLSCGPHYAWFASLFSDSVHIFESCPFIINKPKPTDLSIFLKT